MSWHVWIAFVATSAIIGLIPGPGVMGIVGFALSAGRRIALASVAGMAVGNAIAMTLSLLGVGALLSASAVAFAVFKWMGIFYLIGLGLWTIARSSASGVETEQRAPPDARSAFANMIMVGTFHPKTIVFFVAFVPQFISPAGNYAHEAGLLVVTFCLVVGATDTIYALAASHLFLTLRQPRAALWSRRAGGGVLVASGVLTAVRS